MAGIRKQKSISKIFARYIILFCVITAVLVGFYYLMFFKSIDSGLILPANYYERSIENQREAISKADKVSDVIPGGCSYAVYDAKGKLIETNVSEDKAADMMNRIKYNKTIDGKKLYKYIERKDGICIVQYRLNAEFANETLRRYLPNCEVMYNYSFLVIFIIEIFILSRLFRKRLNKEMDILKQTTAKVAMENLDFNVQYSGITEINDVISALDKMKEELSDSLKKQWKMEEARKSQISALAHDIKTPLTIIKGNSELLNELDLTEEQKEFNDSILKESGNIEFYIKSLIDINKSQQSQSIVKEDINSRQFINDIIKQGEFMCLNKDIKFASDVKEVSETFIGDISCLKRAVMNVLSNAVHYTPKRGRILFSVYSDDKYMHFVIEDSGRGFSKEELTMATEEFYQGDKSRNSRDHYGMGLYIADTFVKKHDGAIRLSKAENLGGARVELTIII